MKTKIILLFTALLVLSCKNENEKKPISEAHVEESVDSVQLAINNNADEFLKNSSVSSISIGVFKNGKEYVSHFGEIDSEKENTPTDSTYYEIASITKTFTGTLVAQAVLDGKLTLDDDIRKYLDGDFKNLEYKGNAILIRHILTHTSGLPTFNKEQNLLFEKDTDSLPYKLDEIQKKFNRKKFFDELKEIQIKTVPGTHYNYSNLGSNLMGTILENVYQKPIEELLHTYVFEKAGMSQTKMHLSDNEKPLLANGYNDENALMPHLYLPKDLWGTDGSLKSTMPDLIKYLKWRLTSGNAAVAESQKKLYQDGDDEWIGHFLGIEKDKDGIYYPHHGGLFGFNSLIAVYPEYNMCVAAITNTGGRQANGVLSNVIHGLVDDLKPFGQKSIKRVIKQISLENIDKGIAKYHELKKTDSTIYKFDDENELNSLGYELLAVDKTQDAIKLFILNTEMFPEAWNPYDSLGEGYFVAKDYDNALINYKKSLELNPQNENAQMMIDQIKKLLKEKVSI